MRIEDKVRLGYESLARLDKQKELEKKDRDSVQLKKQDRVEISRAKKEVDTLKIKLKNASDVRIEKVKNIKEQIESGTYDISGKKVAEKIVNLAIDNLF
ncbi:flagellar biosynthesis anti-sigma factor FlgM [Deferribacter autotrophicus]|uniref:Negative regulator of flagellin synthesis n=1 Tax=Deferribacter autotrophicus TaxID=500465 RepID=A0A5A8F5N7_9BACT|nr:flagellar biosynthesis anti-sigma factor FlgM [Deferribacter autotrophicus]KAA0258763.1 flagellar biosynthesis anti-sigma factor FlgM [Deferribacter autotrophicus]